MDARERELTLEREADERAARATRIRRAVVVLAGAVVAVIVISVSWSWITRHYYVLGGEPEFQGHTASYFAELLTDEDHYRRRQGAIVLDRMADSFNERTAREIVPALQRALGDTDTVVQVHAKSALDKIARTTGVS